MEILRILIENAVPLNNGDAALIYAVGDKFENNNDEVTYSTTHFEEVQKKYPNKNWIKTFISLRGVNKPVFGFWLLFLNVLFSKKHREFDAIISAPGGYINSYYGFKRKLQLMVLYKKLFHKKIYMYSQSIGPLSSEDERVLQKYIPYFDLFYVRDDISKKRVEDLGFFINVVQTKDAAFLLKNKADANEKTKKVAISVRSWKHDNRSEEKYKSLIYHFIKFFHDKDYEITFLSTCQGESSYVDDSLMAKEIYDELPNNIQQKVIVDSESYTLEELRIKLTEFDYVVGTRLHMCILSWLSGTPAFNISYEEKGKECYNYMNINHYSVDYNYNKDLTEELESFYKLEDRNSIFKRIDTIQEETNEFFEKLYLTISK